MKLKKFYRTYKFQVFSIWFSKVLFIVFPIQEVKKYILKKLENNMHSNNMNINWMLNNNNNFNMNNMAIGIPHFNNNINNMNINFWPINNNFNFPFQNFPINNNSFISINNMMNYININPIILNKLKTF